MKFLIFGGPGIGDTIIELTLAKGLKIHYPGAEVDLIVSNSLGAINVLNDLLDCQDYIDNCFFYTKKELLKTGLLFLKLRYRKFDYGFFCTTSFKAKNTASKICRFLGCKSVIKEIKGKTGHIDIPVSIPENIHIVQQYECLFNELCPQQKLDIEVLNTKYLEGLVNFNSEGRKIITICLGSNITIYKRDGKTFHKNIKEWDISNWCELANTLVEKGYKIVFIGGKKEREALKHTDVQLNKLVDTSYLGKATVKESISILSLSELVIGADTGMMHCAAALGKKTLSLFGGTPADVWRPYSPYNVVIIGDTDCSPCYGKDYAINCVERKCMKKIRCEKVLECVDGILGD